MQTPVTIDSSSNEPKDAADSRILVVATGLGIRRAGRWLIHGVDLAIARGEIVTCIGPNGGGKTTLARALLGLIRPDEGRVEMSPGVRVGYVPQRLSIDQALPLDVTRLMTLTGRHSADAITEALGEVGIAHLADAPVQELSGGEFQRALIARALIRKPDLLVLDEPAQGVDFAGEVSFYELIGDIRARLGCGVLLISHDLHLVMAKTDSVICLNGHVCCSGAPHAVAADPSYRGLFGERAAEALALYHHEHDHAHLADGRAVPLDRAEDH